MKKKSKNVVMGVTASIAAYKSCDIIRHLKNIGCDTKVIMSPDAGRFITPLTLQTISCNEVVTDMFHVGGKWNIYHTSLAEWADIILVAPATADMISKLACGLANCALSAVVLASKADILIAPAMNENMYTHKAVQGNIKKLKSFGYEFIAPKRGYLACGYEGVGHIADTKDIIEAVKKII